MLAGVGGVGVGGGSGRRGWECVRFGQGGGARKLSRSTWTVMASLSSGVAMASWNLISRIVAWSPGAGGVGSREACGGQTSARGARKGRARGQGVLGRVRRGERGRGRASQSLTFF